MRILIKKLGPIDKAELELGDITVLIGPPNVGKSYTLKALYALLLPLDGTALDNLLRQTIPEILEPRFVRIEGIFHALIGLVAFYKLRPHEVNKILEMVKHKINADQIVIKKERENRITISFRKKMNIDLEEINRLIREAMHNVLQEILPTNEKTQIAIKDEALPKTLLPEFLKALEPLESNPLTSIRSGELRTYKLYIKERISLNLIAKKRKIALEDIIIISIDEKSSLLKSFIKELERTLFKIPKTRKIPYQEILDLLTRPSLLEPIEVRFFLRRFRMLPYEPILKRLVENIGDAITRLYQDILGIKSILFIPFERSPLVYQLEYISQEPIHRRAIIRYQEFNMLSYSYISRLSRGRSKLSEGKYDEKIVKIFKPIIQGNLWYDKQTGVIMYKRWGFEELYQKHEGVPIKWASALASEIAGMLLPILDAPRNSCIFIEEPESQLHPSAQVLMALGLAGLSNAYGHKLVISTHSDILAVTLAYIKALKPSKEKVLELITDLLEIQGIYPKDEDLEFLAEKASSATNIDIRFYYYEPTPSGVIVREEKPTNIMEHVPGITKTIDILASWAMNL